MKCVAYIRVSTREQDEEIQRKSIEEFCKSRGISILGFYIDKGESGRKIFIDRPSAGQLLEDIERIKPSCIVSWSLDRLGRTMVDTLNTVLEFEKKGVKVLTVKEEWLQTLDDNIRRLVLSILSWVAEFERRRIRERQEEAWRMGKQKGRPPKVRDDVILKYLKRYQGLSKKDIWRIMKSNGHDISYDRFLKRLKKLVKVKEVLPRRGR